MKKGGGALMHVYVWEHIISLYYRTASWMFTKLGRDKVLMVPYKCCYSARSVQGWIQGGAKIGHGGSPSSTNFCFRLEGYSNKPNSKQWSRSMLDVVLLQLYFRFHSKVNNILDLVILPYFNAISVDFYAVKCLSTFIFCSFHVCNWKNVCIKDLNALRI